MSACVKCYDVQTKWMYFLIEDDDLLEKNIILFWIKVSSDIKKVFDSEPIYHKIFMKTKNEALRWWSYRFSQ